MPQDKIRVSRNAQTENRLARASRWVIDPKTNNNDFLQMPGDRFSGLVIDGATAVTKNGNLYIVDLSEQIYSASLEVNRGGTIRSRAECNFELSLAVTSWSRVFNNKIPIPTMPPDVLVQVTAENVLLRSELEEIVAFDLESGYIINFRIAGAQPSSGRS